MIDTIRISLWTLVMEAVFPEIILALLIGLRSVLRRSGFRADDYHAHFISVVVIVSMLNIFLTLWHRNSVASSATNH